MTEAHLTVTAEEKWLSAIGYVGVLCILPLLLKRDSKFTQFHAKQGLVLFIAWIANTVLAMIPILGWVASFVLAIILLVLSIIGIIKSLAGEYWDMPYLAAYAKKINL